VKIAMWHNLPSGGGKRALYHHVKGLLERGHTIEAWCPPTADQAYLPLSALIPEHVVPMDWEPKTLAARLGQAPGPLPFTRRKLAAMDRHCRECAAQINSGGFDVLLANSSVLFGTSPIGRYVQTPRALYLQEPFRALYEASPQLLWVALPDAGHLWTPRRIGAMLKDLAEVQSARLQAREELRDARAFDRLLVNSQFSRESVLRAYNLSARVCYLGIDTTLFQPSGRAKEPFVVGLGSIAPAKGIKLSLDAVAALGLHLRPPLVWIGNYSDPDYLAHIKDYAAQQGVDLQIKVRVTDGELVDMLSRAAVMLYTPRLEPFGFAPLEANACGTPVVAVAEGGVRETLQPGVNGTLVADDDPAALGAALRPYLEDLRLAEQAGRTARQYVLDRWRWETAVQRLEEHLLSLAFPAEEPRRQGAMIHA